MVRRIREEREHEQQQFTWRQVDEAPDPRDVARWPILLRWIDSNDGVTPDSTHTVYLNQMSQVLWHHDSADDTWLVTSLLQLG